MSPLEYQLESISTVVPISEKKCGERTRHSTNYRDNVNMESILKYSKSGSSNQNREHFQNKALSTENNRSFFFLSWSVGRIGGLNILEYNEKGKGSSRHLVSATRANALYLYDPCQHN